MTDDTTKTPAAADRNGSDAGTPFGGLAIDFSGDTGAVPLAAAVAPIAFAPTPSQPPASDGSGSAAPGEGRTESKRRSSSAPARPGLTAAIYAARANLEPIVLAGSAPGGQLMLTSDVENYPGFPDGHPGPGPDGPVPRPGRALRDADRRRRHRPGRLLERPFRLWARGVEYRGQSVIVATGASAMWLGLESETRLRGRGVSRLRDVRRVLLPRQGDRGRRRRRHRVRGGDLPDPLRDEGPPAPPARRVPGAARSWSTGRSSNPKIEIHTNTAVEEVLGDDEGRRRSACATPSTGEERTMAAEGLFIAIGHKPEHRGVPRLARGRREGLPRGPRPDRHARSRACSSPATSTTTATARPSPPPATAARRRSTPSAGSSRRASPKRNTLTAW